MYVEISLRSTPKTKKTTSITETICDFLEIVYVRDIVTFVDGVVVSGFWKKTFHDNSTLNTFCLLKRKRSLTYREQIDKATNSQRAN